jgi:hypothetical protein
MQSIPRRLRYVVALGTAALLVGGCSKSEAPTASSSPTSASSKPSKQQQFVDSVNGLCDALLPDVMRATHGGSIDIPATQYLHDWPAHRAVLVAFDKLVAALPLPVGAETEADAWYRYTKFADRLDAARLKAAKQGEAAWRREVAAEANVENDPTITALKAAGYADSCEAR